MGDVIMVTPIVKRLRADYGPSAVIDVMTFFPQVLFGNRDVNNLKIPVSSPPPGYDRVIDLNGVYENRRNLHVVDAYMSVAFGSTECETKELFIQQDAFNEGREIDWSRAVVVHSDVSQRNLTMPRDFWEALIEMLVARKISPVIVGTKNDGEWPNKIGVIDLTDQLSIQQTAWVIGKAACFVSCDSGVMHIAGSTQTPMVTIFTSVRAEYRMPWRNGVLGYNVTPISPLLDCIGCNDLFNCRRNDFACVEGPAAIGAESVVSAIMSYI